jgi:uncharacterized protein YjbI with pentapeptide repeats
MPGPLSGYRVTVPTGPDVRRRSPAKARRPASPQPSDPTAYLADEAVFRQLGFDDVDLAGQEADAVEFDRCAFTRATLAGVVAERAAFTDCVVERSDWANLRATKSRMQRVELTSTRFARCELAGIGSVTALRGATLTDQDLVALSHTLATALGIAIEQP